MKKLCLILIAVLMLCASAYAVQTDGQGELIARSGELAAFLDGSGNIYVSGLETPTNSVKAETIISIDPYRILYFAQADALAGIPEGRLISLTLDDFAHTAITDDAYAACLSGDEIYYISRSSRNQLMRYDLNTQHTAVVFTANEALERIYAASNGIIATLVEGAGAYITDAVTGQFVPYAGNVATEIALFEGFELTRTDNNNLYVKLNGAFTETFVDSGVQAFSVIEDTIYYLSGTSEMASLKRYDVLTGTHQLLMNPSANMQVQLTASEKQLFMLSKDNKVYTVDPISGSLKLFAALPEPSSYALSAGKSISAYLIEAVSGQLNIYGEIEDKNTLPTFSFVDFTTQIVQDNTEEIALLSAYSISGEQTVWTLLQPAPQYSTLRKGNRGDAVAAIQQPLFDLNYYDYRIDGIFGWRTEQAIELLQMDLGMEVTGIADAELQKLILSGRLSAYDPYKGLSRGDRGYRVEDMQLRLRDLGYLADSADAIFGPRTQVAVETFQQENGLHVTGIADSATLRRLYSDSARTCSSYIDLERGDSGYRVRELNRRLKELYYLDGSVGNNYNSATVAAVLRFQEEMGLKQTGKATSAVQKKLFASHAPEYSGYITLRRGDENARVKDMQRRLAELNYYSGRHDGYFGKNTYEAVRAFQRKVGLEATGVADPTTLKELYSSNAPSYQQPEKISKPIIELNAYTRYENGFYYISDTDTTDGDVKVNWFADGGVASYDIIITDDRGNEYTRAEKVSMTIASIPVSSLDAERTYTITVNAHPIDAKNDKTTSASIRFVRILPPVEPEIGVINSLVITPASNVVSFDGSSTYTMAGDIFTFNWSADGDVAGYAYSISDFNGNYLEVCDSVSNVLEVSIDSAQLIPGDVYILNVQAVPVNGTISDAVARSIGFIKQAEETPELPDEPTEEPTIEPTPEPTVEPTEEPTIEPTEDTTIEPTAEPEAPIVLPIGTPVLRIEPSIGSAWMEVPSPEGEMVGADVLHLAEGEITFNWAAEGEVGGYNVRITDAYGMDMVNQNMTGAGASIPSANLQYGMPYCLTVTAYSVDGSSSTNARLYFALPAPTAPIVDEPMEEPVIDEPVIEEPIGEPVSEEPTEVPEIEDPVAEDPVIEEPVVETTPEPTPEPTEEPTPEPTEEPTLEPTEEPTPEPIEESSYPMDDPGAWQDPISASSDAEAIAAIQLRLTEWFWLEEDSFKKGKMDDATIQAVIDFQTYCMENGLNVIPVDPADPIIETDTLRLLFNADGAVIENPNF